MPHDPAFSVSRMNARDPADVVHAVKVNDTPHDWGQFCCGERYYWISRVLSPVEMVDLLDGGKPWPANPTKEKVSCLKCLATTSG